MKRSLLKPFSLAAAIVAGLWGSSPAQAAPTVSLTSPASGASYAAPLSLTLTAGTTDADGTVTNVAFYQGTTLLGNASTAPFTVTTANLFAGGYALTAVATDNNGLSTTSSVVNVTVTNTPSLAILQSIKTVFVIAMENHDLVQKNPTGSPQQILGNPAAPYFNSLITPGNPNAAQTAWATHMFSCAINGEHPSEPNYVWQEAGTDFGIRTDNDPYPATSIHNVFTNVIHLSGQLTAAGIPWRTYQEDVQLGAGPTHSASGANGPVNIYNGTTDYNYAVKHNPMEFFPDTQNLNCYPLSQFWTDLADGNIGRYNWITPDQYNEWHSSLPNGYTYKGVAYTGDQAAIAEGDNCLSIIIPQIEASAAYQDHGVIIIWTDETESTDDTNTTLPYVIISPLAKGNAYASTLPYSHSSDLKTMDEIFGLAYQTNAIPAAYLDAQNTGYDYVDGHSAPINDLGDFFQGIGSDAPALMVQQAGTPLANGGSAASFGAVNIGANSTETFTITNTGSAALVLTNIAATGANAGDFTVSGLTLPATVQVGTSATFMVTFAPSTGAAESATLQISDNDTNTNPFTVALAGTGVFVPPTVSLNSPASGASYAAPLSLTLTAGTTDADGTVTNVAFYQGTTLLGNATTAPFTVTTANLFAGNYALTAVATDNNGLSTTSSVVNVTVTNTPALAILQSIKTVFVIAMENHDLVQKNPTGSPQQILGNPAAPYFNSLITPGNSNSVQTAWANHYFSCAINGEHPSEPNYVWQEAGTDFGIRTDNDPSASSHNVFTNVQHLSAQLTTAGIPWRTYQEDVQYSSAPTISASGSGKPVNPYNGTTDYNYAVKHNPMEFFPDTQNINCYPLTNFWTDLANGNIGRYNWITPDQYNEWHSSLPGGYTYQGVAYTGDQAAIAEGDNALSIILPQIEASAAYKDHGVIIIWTDETESTDDTNTTLPYVIISPLAKGNAYASTLPYSHASDLKTMDEIFQLAYQTNTIPLQYGGAPYLDAQNTGTNYVDGRSATVYDLSDFFQGVGSDAPALTVQQAGAPLANGGSAANFGSVNIGANVAETITVTNTGTSALVLSNLVTTGANAGDFTVSGLTLPATVQVGTSATFMVTFAPTTGAVESATLQISDNDTNNNPYTLTLSGTGVLVPPTISLNSPASGASYAAPLSLTLTAGTTDADGTVTNVAFYQGTTLLGNATTAPFTVTTANLFAGNYALTAVATDNNGLSTTSSVVNVTVTNTIALQALQSIKTIFVIAMENHDLVQKNPTGSPQQILGNPAAPYFNSLITPGNPNAAQVSYATHMFSVAINGEHPSEPNYVWQEAGTDFGIRTDNDPSPSSHNVFTNVQHLSAQLTTAGIPWRTYQEDVQYSSAPTISASGSGKPVNPYNGTTDYNYAVKHNPMEFFPDTQNLNCYPLTNFWTDLTNGNIGRYNWITPDQYNEWHSSLPGGYTYLGVAYTGDQAAIAEGDNALSIIVPKIMASQAYQDHGAIIIWTDETESTDDTNTTLPYVIISPLAKGNAYASTLPYSHASDLKTMDEIFQLAYQTNTIPLAYAGAPYLDAQNAGINYVDGRSATINDLSDFFAPGGVKINGTTIQNNGNFQLSFFGPSGQMYEVLATSNLVLPQSAWTIVASGTFGSTNVVFTDPNTASYPGRYYVVKSP